MNSKRIFFFLLSIVASGVFFLCPWNIVNVAPPILIRVLDESGNPVARATVQEKWEYASIGSISYREKSKANEDGYASFPERTERISLLRLVASNAINKINPMHGYGYGPKLTVWAYGDDPHVWYHIPINLHKELPQEIRLKRNSKIRTPDDTEYP